MCKPYYTAEAVSKALADRLDAEIEKNYEQEECPHEGGYSLNGWIWICQKCGKSI